MKELITAPLGSRRYREPLLASLQARIQRGGEDSFIMVFPTSHLLHQTREHLVTRAARQLNLFTFDELAERLLDRPIELVTGRSREHVFEHILQELSTELQCFRPDQLQPGMIGSILQAVVTMRRTAVTADMVKSDNPLVEDIATVCRRYERFLAENELMDLEEVYFQAGRRLEAGITPAWLSKVDWLLVDQYFDFEPLLFSVLDALAQKIDSVTVTMPFVHQEPYTLVSETIAELQRRGFKVRHEAGENRTPLSQLADKLFVPGAEPAPAPVTELAADTVSAELDLVAATIKDLAADGVKPNEICLVVSDQDKYLPPLREQFRRHQIDVNLPIAVSLTSVPWVRELLAIWEAAASLEPGVLTNLVKAKYINHYLPQSGDPDAAELLIRQFGEHANGCWPDFLDSQQARLHRAWENGSDDWERGQYQQPLEVLSAGSEYIKAAVKAVAAWFPGGGAEKYSAARHCSLLKALLQVNRERICPEGAGELDLRDRLAYKTVQQIIRAYLQTAQRVSQADLTAGGFLREIKIWLEQTVALEHASPAAIPVLRPSQARGVYFKHVFVLGLNQGVLPRQISTNWLLSRPAFQGLAGALAVSWQDTKRDLERQKLEFHNCVVMAESGLWLSRLLPGLQEEAMISDFLREVRALTSVETLVRDGAEPFPQLNAVINPRQLAGRLVMDMVAGKQTAETEIGWSWLLCQDWFDGVRDCMEMELGRESSSPADKFDGALESARQKVGTRFRRGVYSISRLEQYIRCPFAFYASYVLALSPLPGQRPEYSPLERGEFLHWILEHFYKRHILTGRIPTSLSEALTNVASEYMEANGWDTSSPVWQLRLREAVAQLAELIQGDLEWIQSSGLRPALLEATFGLPGSEVGPVSLGGEVSFHGKIDRVDILEQDGQCLACVYDYKSSREIGASRIMQGKSFQIPVYLVAAEALLRAQGYKNARVLGGGYYVLKTGQRRGGIWSKEFNTLTGNRLKALSAEAWEQLTDTLAVMADNYHNEIMSGRFTPRPDSERDCLWCDFRYCCRHDKNRLRRKGV
ncbi:MAG: hypothetical protein FH749_00780 [Firmicutes bacterium]|nr:hypothetical protein [Bacillota bacterium]